MNFNHLYYFYVTGQSKNATEAAKRLCISQPSLSSQLKTLEDFLQVKLFKKSGRNRLLTEAGRNVFTLCKKMFLVSEELDEYLHFQSGSFRKDLRIGIVDDIEESLISSIINIFLTTKSKEIKPKVCTFVGREDDLAERLKLR